MKSGQEYCSEDYSIIRTKFDFAQETLENVTESFKSTLVSARCEKIEGEKGTIIHLYPFSFSPKLSKKDPREFGIKMIVPGHLDDRNDCANLIEAIWMPIKKNAIKSESIERDKRHKQHIHAALEKFEIDFGRKPTKGEKNRIKKEIARIDYGEASMNAITMLGRLLGSNDDEMKVTTLNFLRDSRSDNSTILYDLSIKFADELTRRIVNERTPEDCQAAAILLEYRKFLEKRLPLGN